MEGWEMVVVHHKISNPLASYSFVNLVVIQFHKMVPGHLVASL